jgi:hypothetical protein
MFLALNVSLVVRVLIVLALIRAVTAAVAFQLAMTRTADTPVATMV